MLEDSRESSLQQWEDYWAILRRRRWWFLLPLFLGWAVVWAVSWYLPAAYRSETLILVEHQKVPEHYVLPNVASDIQDRLQTMTQQILSRTRLLRIIDDFRLYSTAQARLSPEQLVGRMRQDIRIDLVRASGRRAEVTAFKVSYSAPNPRVAQQVTSELTSLFIEENLRVRHQQSERTTAFLASQLNNARDQLAGQEEQLRKFKTRYLGQLPEQLQSNVQILSGLHTRLQVALAGLNQAEQQRLYLESLLMQHSSLQAELEQGRTTTISRKLLGAVHEELDRSRTLLADLQARYTGSHPDLRRAREQILETQKLKQQIETEIALATNESKSDEADETRPTDFGDLRVLPPMMQIEGQLEGNRLETENRKRDIKQLEARIERYQTRLNLIPLREQQLASITRDYKLSKKNYESLLAKRMQSELASNLENRQQGEQFRILDPPDLPKKPYWPDRAKLSLIGLLVGVVLGVGSAVGVELIDDRIHGERDLKRLVSVAVLTVIPPLPTVWEQRRQRWCRRFEWLGGTMLVAAMAAGNFITYYME